ncbi:MAG TPA: efflux RND transporter periplasmic adaptor subunit [Planctomycetota bacterium]|nr:efflux RND transporter periplasmic adaptor subunit [Planctomycetota bacterium]
MRKKSSAFLILPLVAVAACKRTTQEPTAAADTRVLVSLQPVKVQPVTRTVEVVGTLYGDEAAVLAAKVPGRIAAIEHDVGDAVGAAEVVARVETADYELAVAQKQAALQAALAELGLQEPPVRAFDVEQVPAVQKAWIEARNAEQRWHRAEAMFAEKPPLITEQEHADLRTAWLSAVASRELAVAETRAKVALAAVRQAELAQSQKQLADTAVAAPAGGPWRVGRRLVAVGDYVKQGDALFHVVDPDPIVFRADVHERWSAAVEKGQHVVVEVPSASAPVTGVVDRIGPVADQRKRTFEVEIRIDNSAGRLLPGGFARGAVATRVDPGVVFVPQDAVVVALGLSKVFTVKDGKAVEHKVTTGAHDGAFLEVTKGDLAPGDQVVTSGAARLAEGVAVRTAARAGDGR